MSADRLVLCVHATRARPRVGEIQSLFRTRTRCSNVLSLISSVTTGRFVMLEVLRVPQTAFRSLGQNHTSYIVPNGVRQRLEQCVEHGIHAQVWVSARVAFRRASASALALSASARAACAVNRCSAT